jgi:hypothetical protein
MVRQIKITESLWQREEEAEMPMGMIFGDPLHEEIHSSSHRSSWGPENEVHVEE